MAVSENWGILCVGVLMIGALLFGVYCRAPDGLYHPTFVQYYGPLIWNPCIPGMYPPKIYQIPNWGP